MHRLSVAVLIAAVVTSACTPGQQLMSDVRLDTSPTLLWFKPPLSVPSGQVAVCFEFERPGDSQAAAWLKVRLLMQADTIALSSDDIDRTGESSVCIRGKVPPGRDVTGMIVTAPRPVQVRHIDWQGTVTR